MIKIRTLSPYFPMSKDQSGVAELLRAKYGPISASVFRHREEMCPNVNISTSNINLTNKEAIQGPYKFPFRAEDRYVGNSQNRRRWNNG